TLLIGVDDNDKVLGLESTDYKSFSAQGKLIDSWSKHWDSVLRNYLGDAVHNLVTCELVKLEEGTVAIVHVEKPSPKPVWLTHKAKGDAEGYIGAWQARWN
ncbi:MAG: putative DNA binding domain-containing protein, partial [Flavobacteriales bacterium]|nr:putative DNA binding domain-containing protein [Flavobacteriales bacterium]